MEKLLTEMLDYNISEDVFSNYGNTTSLVIDFASKKSRKQKTLTACVQYLCKINDIEHDLTGVCVGFDNVVLNDELSDRKVRYLARELARAIDSNSVVKVKEIKKEFGNDKEFLVAKKFLDTKCKEVWNVFEAENKILKIPYEALKSLGITNQPTLEFLLGDSVRFYEKDEGSTTSDIISSVLKNINISYDINDIHKFLKTANEKENCKYNFKTVIYLISEHNYDNAKLQELGVEKKTLDKAVKYLSIGQKIKYLLNISKLKAIDAIGVLYKTLDNIKSLRRI